MLTWYDLSDKYDDLGDYDRNSITIITRISHLKIGPKKLI